MDSWCLVDHCDARFGSNPCIEAENAEPGTAGRARPGRKEGQVSQRVTTAAEKWGGNCDMGLELGRGETVSHRAPMRGTAGGGM